MQNIITNNFKTQIAKSLESDFSDPTRSIYFFYGRPLAWENEPNPPTLTPSNLVENATKSNILALKKINDRDLILGVTKYTWTSGTSYAEYSNLEDMAGTAFYVITDDNRVYKCLDNGSGLDGVANESTVKPEHTDGIEKLADGYIWQYMFRVSDPINRKFTADQYIPIDVNDPINQNTALAAVPGTITKIKISSGGAGYYIQDDAGDYFDDIPLYILGNGTENASGKIRITSITAQGSINTLNSYPVTGLPGAGYDITDVGAEYQIDENQWSAVLIRQISSLTNVNAANQFEYAYGIAKIGATGTIETMRIVDPGKGFTLGEAEVVQSSCMAFAKIDANGSIISTNIPGFWGQNFTTASVVVVSDRNLQTFVAAELTPVLSPPAGHASNPETELISTSLLFNMRIAYEELGGDFAASNDFRSVGLIQNVEYQYEDANGQIQKNISTQLTLSATTDITLTTDIDPNDFSADSTITGIVSGAKGTIVEVLNNRIIRVIRDIESSNTVPFILNEGVITTDGGNGLIASVAIPEYAPFSGDIMLINNREAIQRSNDQIETINFILNL